MRSASLPHLLELPLAALMSSSAKHSAMDLMFLKEASRAPVHSSQMAWKRPDFFRLGSNLTRLMQICNSRDKSVLWVMSFVYTVDTCHYSSRVS